MNNEDVIPNPFTQNHPDYESLKHLTNSILLIEGNIGSGKTTLVRQLKSFLNKRGIPTITLEEKVNMKMLGLFLSDPKKYAFVFQIHMLTERRNLYEKAVKKSRNDGKVVIVDRSLYGDLTFALTHKKDGNISKEEWATYNDLMNENKIPEPTAVFYVDTPPKVCVDRIRVRDRYGEKDAYQLDYIQKIHDNYLEVLSSIGIEYHPVSFGCNSTPNHVYSYGDLMYVLELV